jgi:hypothetical protein
MNFLGLDFFEMDDNLSIVDHYSTASPDQTECDDEISDASPDGSPRPEQTENGETVGIVYELTPWDVLTGRGSGVNNQNRRYIRSVRERKSSYVAASNKRAVASKIVSDVKANGGRFLSSDGVAGGWRVLNDYNAANKVMATMRGLIAKDSTSRNESVGMATLANNSTGSALPQLAYQIQADRSFTAFTLSHDAQASLPTPDPGCCWIAVQVPQGTAI